MISKRSLLSAIAILALGAVVAGPAAAQTYPSKPIKLIVPFPPGGPVDVAARLVGQHLPRVLGATVMVENRAGAAGALGAKAVANAEPDGYTLLCGNISSLVVLPAVTGNRDYDPAKAFAPVAKILAELRGAGVHPGFPARSVGELVASPRPIPASSISDRQASVMPRIWRRSCSSCAPASTSSTSPTKARPRR